MRTIVDLEKMKEKPTVLAELVKEKGIDLPISKNTYERFIDSLEHYYISKSDGKECIKNELSNWDKEAQRYIVEDLIDRLKKVGIQLTMGDLMELI